MQDTNKTYKKTLGLPGNHALPQKKITDHIDSHLTLPKATLRMTCKHHVVTVEPGNSNLDNSNSPANSN